MANASTVQVVLDKTLLEKIMSAGRDNGRTLSAEIRFVLNQYYYDKAKK